MMTTPLIVDGNNPGQKALMELTSNDEPSNEQLQQENQENSEIYEDEENEIKIRKQSLKEKKAYAHSIIQKHL